MTHNKPQIALLGIMQELYDASYPGITERQGNYAKQVAQRLEDVADIYFPGPARTREDIEKYIAEFNQKNMDGIIIVMLTYSPGLRLVNAGVIKC